MQRRFIVAALVLFVGSGIAQAQNPSEPDGCAGFDWSVRREQAWFSAAGLPRLASGATLPQEMPGATLELSADAQARLPVKPSREPKPETRGGVLMVSAPLMPGLYQITLSEKAWIDVSQDGATTRPPVATTGRQGCAGIAKSLRFQLGAQPVAVMVSGATTDSIAIAVVPAE